MSTTRLFSHPEIWCLPERGRFTAAEALAEWIDFLPDLMARWDGCGQRNALLHRVITTLSARIEAEFRTSLELPLRSRHRQRYVRAARRQFVVMVRLEYMRECQQERAAAKTLLR